MQHQFSRTRLLIGQAAINTLDNSRVAVFGMGGVGGYAVEVLARSGVGEMHIFDNDRVCLTNLNRQIYALHSTVGKLKVDVAEERIRDINPNCIVRKFRMFYLASNANDVDLSVYDYVVDCIDTVSAKVELIRRCHALHVPIISCMGAANKMDATAFRVTDIYKTQTDPLAKIVRKKLRKLHIPRLKVVCSTEEPFVPAAEEVCCERRTAAANGSANEQIGCKSIPASNAFVPAAAGIVVGGQVVKDLIKKTFRQEAQT